MKCEGMRILDYHAASYSDGVSEVHECLSLNFSAADAGDKQKVKTLIEKGATFAEWDNCTDACVETMFHAQWEVRAPR